ncbi:MAG: hypothetical protein K6B41_14980 [Butyrivibrio sp.]|nr:hypothetical protein [Butyrivibrio sp.]
MKLKFVNEAEKTKLITPFVTLFGTAIVSIVTFIRGFVFGEWIVIVFACVLIFLTFGFVLEKVIVHFMDVNMAEERRLEEEAAAKEAEEAAAAAALENGGEIPGADETDNDEDNEKS